MSEPLTMLQEWYRAQCDGEWEHQYGVSVETLDNPGWMLHVDLSGTSLEGQKVEYTVLRDDQEDWVHFWCDGERFEAASGPLGLTAAMEEFVRFLGVGSVDRQRG